MSDGITINEDGSRQIAPDRVEQIMEAWEAGHRLASADKISLAQTMYELAVERLPEPKTTWDISVGIYSQLANLYYLKGDEEGALQRFADVLEMPEGRMDALTHLRLGQIYFHREDWETAADQLMRAYMLEGEDIFEFEDPEYLEFLGSVADLEPVADDAD